MTTKKEELIEKYAGYLQGEPADGGHSFEETKEFLTEFLDTSHTELAEEVRKLKNMMKYANPETAHERGLIAGLEIGFNQALDQVLQLIEKRE